MARLAGLSVTQTSRALNGHADVSADSRKRARKAANQLGYAPNLEARRLKMPDTRSQSIGLVLVRSQRFSDPFLGDLLTTMVDEAAIHEHELQLFAPLSDEDPKAPYDRAIAAKRVDGFIVLRTALNDPRVQFLAERPFPFATFGMATPDDRFPAVAEQADCLQPAVDHLVELGHERIGFLSEPPEFSVGADRHRSFLRAMAARGLDVEDHFIIPCGFRDDTAFTATLGVLETKRRPSAVVSSNDLLALGAMRAAAAKGLKVPDEFSVVGFDNIAATRFSSPTLTTLGHAEGTIGRHLVAQLLKAIGEPGPIEPIRLRPQLIIRESTAPVGLDR